MLRRVRVENFKAWRDTGSLELAPLTLLFGTNSSGKSSINHLLALLKQTVRSPDRNAVFDFGDARSLVRLGSFKDAVFRHDLERTLRFELEWALEPTLSVRDPLSGHRYSGDRLSFIASARQFEGQRALQSQGFEYTLSQGGGKELSAVYERDEKRQNRWRLETSGYVAVRNPGRPGELPKPAHFYGFPNEALVFYQNTQFLSDLELALETQLNQLSYLGPIRSGPERLYTWSGVVPEDVGLLGENAVQAVLAARGRALNWQAKARRAPFQDVVGRWLRRLGLASSFDVAEIAPERDLYEVRVRAQARSDVVTLSDVGFGVSQVLPVIVQVFYAPAHSTVLIEQPELHLHPGAQSALGDLLIEAVQAREEGLQRGVQLIVESHSEHLLRRIQRRVAEGKIKDSDVAVYVCRQSGSGSVAERLELDLFGDIRNWPPDFFGDELEDVVVQARLSAKGHLDKSAASK